MSARIIESSSQPQTRARLTAQQTERLYSQIGERLDPRNRTAFQWLDTGSARTDTQKRAVCDLLIDMYSEVNTLPPDMAAPLLREMLTAG